MLIQAFNLLMRFHFLRTTLGIGGQSYAGLAGIARPILCVTGTRDGDVLGTGATPDKRAGVFTALPAGNKAQLVLKHADHMTFAGQPDRAGQDTWQTG